MAIAPDDVGTGATIVFATSAFTGNILSISWSGISRTPIDTTHLGSTTARSFMAGDLYDPGEIQVEMAFDPAAAPPYGGAAETVTITFPAATPKTWAATCFMSNFQATAPLEDKMTASFTLKVSGAITLA